MYKIIVFKEHLEIAVFENFKTINELNEWVEKISSFDYDYTFDIFDNNDNVIGYLQETPTGLVAVKRNESGDEILLGEEED